MKSQKELNPLELFFQSSSDTSNLECSEQEELENRFSEWWKKQQQGYSEEEVNNLISDILYKVRYDYSDIDIIESNIQDLFEQFKNK